MERKLRISETLLARSWVLVVALALAGCGEEGARRTGPDPELVELQRLQSQLGEGPSVREVMKAPKPVDVESLPDKPVLPPNVVVEEKERPAPPPSEVLPVEAPAAPVAVNLANVPLGADGAGAAAGGAPAVAEPPAPPTLAPPAASLPAPVQACLALWRGCRGKGYGTDVCVRDLPRCEGGAAAKGPCCPTACADGYAARRRGGARFEDAARAVFHAEAGGCLFAVAQAAQAAEPGAPPGAPAPEGAAGGLAQPGPVVVPGPGVSPAMAGAVAGAVGAAQQPGQPTPQRIVVTVPGSAPTPAAAPPRPQPAPRPAGGVASESEPRAVESQPIP